MTHREVRRAFTESYTGAKGGNKFTKVQIALAADKAMQKYFSANIKKIEAWFNVISPLATDLTGLKTQLDAPANKDWQAILQ